MRSQVYRDYSLPKMFGARIVLHLGFLQILVCLHIHNISQVLTQNSLMFHTHILYILPEGNCKQNFCI